MNEKKIQPQTPASVSFKELSTRFESLEEHSDLPLIILPKIVLFPGQSLPISSLEGFRSADLHLAQKGLLRVGVISQLDEGKEPSAHLSLFGTEAIITGIIKMSDGSFGAVLKGVRRLVVNSISNKKEGYTGHVMIVGDKQVRQTAKFLASVKALKNLVNKVIKLNHAISQEAVALLYTTDDPVLMCDLMTPYLSITAKEKLAILSNFDIRSRMKHLIKFMSREVELLNISSRIQEEVRNDMHEGLKRNFLREQMAAIKRELGEIDGEVDELEDLQSSFEKLDLPLEVKNIITRETERLAMMHPGSPEYMVSWTYLSWIKDLPWGEVERKKGEAKIPQLKAASRVLNKSHYGLRKVKDRILEYIAVLHHRGNLKGQVLLLVGPPGVGKTSLARSIAEALGRPFVQISLGGVRDEAEIRGHRRTYIGSMPGKIIQGMKTAGVFNPLILLDEIDKLGAAVPGQGDLSAALLELLDPEQNKFFTDHYLGFPFDLSQVIFVTTANTTEGLSEPLMDRLEMVEISSYTESEKVKIATSQLVPSICRDLRLKLQKFDLSETLMRTIIRQYTREAGVRQLRRELVAIGRKLVKRIVAGESSLVVSEKNLRGFLGQQRYFEEPHAKTLSPGVAIGLAYTAFGGDILYIESRRFVGEAKGALTLTGSLGKVMKESAQTAYSFILSEADHLGVDRAEMEKSNIHIHLPDGATPKDGPSAGVALLSAMVSLLSGKEIAVHFAMTGEITLRGKVLPVGGIKEKLLAAHRYGKTHIILPRENWLELEELPPEVLKDLHIYAIDHMMEALFLTGLITRQDGREQLPVKFRRNALVPTPTFPELFASS
ncbi:MAG: endopeptidase La [Deltaproteobacteria bacterium]|nr:endopeptidase La [Deltaproteobacteria bacterium]